MKAPECRVHSGSAASAAACQRLGISLPVSKPATQRADPCRNVCSLGKAGCTPLKCLLARGMCSSARAAHVEAGRPAGSLPPPYWDQQHQEEGARDGGVRAGGACVCAVSAQLPADPSAFGPAGNQKGSWRGATGRREGREGSAGEDAGLGACSQGGGTRRLGGRRWLQCRMSCFGCGSAAVIIPPQGPRQHRATRPPSSSSGWACRWDPTLHPTPHGPAARGLPGSQLRG